MYAKNFHVSIKDLRICAKNPTNDYYTKLKTTLSVAMHKPTDEYFGVYQTDFFY